MRRIDITAAAAADGTFYQLCRVPTAHGLQAAVLQLLHDRHLLLSDVMYVMKRNVCRLEHI